MKTVKAWALIGHYKGEFISEVQTYGTGGNNFKSSDARKRLRKDFDDDEIVRAEIKVIIPKR